MKKLLYLIFLGLFVFLNAQGTITNTVGSNDASSSFLVTNPGGSPLCQIQGNGWTSFGVTPPLHPFHVSANRYDDSGPWLQPVGFFNNTVPNRDGVGVYGLCDNTDFYGVGVYGVGGWTGVRGAVMSTGTDNTNDYNGVYGYATSVGGLTRGVKGYGYQGHRIYGGYFEGHDATDRSYGVRGFAAGAPGNYGVYGLGTDVSAGGLWSVGVYGEATGANPINYGVYGYATGATGTNWAGWFYGDVTVTGALTTSTATYKIDHPLDPENQYLSHAVVESSDMMNIYNGNTELNYAGEAEIELPNWLESLNSDFRYQLTAIGAPGPNLYIAQEVSGNTFRIAGGKPGMKVSWQITGIRNDAYASANPIKVEEYKTTDDIGKYLHPEAFGLPLQMSIHYNENKPILRNEALAKNSNRKERE